MDASASDDVGPDHLRPEQRPQVKSTSRKTTTSAGNSRAHLPLVVSCGLVAAVLFVVGLQLDLLWLRVLVKPLPVVALAAWVVTVRRDRFAHLIMAGLLVCAIADVLLEFREAMFLPGLAVFLIGHLLYLAAFLVSCRQPRVTLLLPFLAMGVGLFLLLRTGLGTMAIPVALYVAAISAMMWRAAARVGGDDGVATWSQWLTLVGAVTFAFSDALIALDRFNAPIEGVRYAIIATYWLAQVLIARSVVESAPAR